MLASSDIVFFLHSYIAKVFKGTLYLLSESMSFHNKNVIIYLGKPFSKDLLRSEWMQQVLKVVIVDKEQSLSINEDNFWISPSWNIKVLKHTLRIQNACNFMSSARSLFGVLNRTAEITFTSLPWAWSPYTGSSTLLWNNLYFLASGMESCLWGYAK